MRPNGTLVGTRWGPISAIRPQPRRRHENEVRAGLPTPPWGSRKLPARLLAEDRRRTLFRTLLRRAEGVPVEFADGEKGRVEEVVFSTLGFDFWPQELLVRIPERTWRAQLRRVPVSLVRAIDVREPRIVVGPTARRLTHDLRGTRVPPRRPRHRRRSPVTR